MKCKWEESSKETHTTKGRAVNWVRDETMANIPILYGSAVETREFIFFSFSGIKGKV